MLFCKGCGGKLYEEYVYTEDHKKMMQIGCLLCWRKVYVELKKWNKFKIDLEKEIERVKFSQAQKRALVSESV